MKNRDFPNHSFQKQRNTILESMRDGLKQLLRKRQLPQTRSLMVTDLTEGNATFSTSTLHSWTDTRCCREEIDNTVGLVLGWDMAGFKQNTTYTVIPNCHCRCFLHPPPQSPPPPPLQAGRPRLLK